MYSTTSSQAEITCKYLTPSAASFEEVITPAVGDKVLFIALEHKSDSMFTAQESIEIDRNNGYTLLSCVAIPVGTIKNAAKTTVTATHDLFKIESTVPVTVTAKTLDVGADTIHLNGDSKSLTMQAPLNTQLQTLVTALQAELVKIASGIVAGGGAYTPGTLSLDISSAATTTIKTGG